jgi:VWFA-related protein
MTTGTMPRIGVAAIVAAALVCLHPLAAARPAGPVTIHVAVERPNGTPVAGLTREDFSLSNESGPCPIESVSGADQPITFVLVLDLTSSVQGMFSTAKAAVEKSFLSSLRPSDRARFGVIAAHPMLDTGFAGDRRTLLASARRLFNLPNAERVGPSPVWDAADAAVSALEAEPGRRAVVLLTDGRATGNLRSVDEVGLHAIAAGVSISIVGLAVQMTIPQTQTTAAVVRPSVMLRRLAEDTGGSCLAGCIPILDLRSGDLGPTLAHLVRDFHRRYEIRFLAGEPDGRAHLLDIRVKTPFAWVRAPRGYVVRSAAPGALHDVSTTPR